MPGSRGFNAATVTAALRASVADLPDGPTRQLLEGDVARYAALLCEALGVAKPRAQPPPVAPPPRPARAAPVSGLPGVQAAVASADRALRSCAAARSGAAFLPAADCLAPAVAALPSLSTADRAAVAPALADCLARLGALGALHGGALAVQALLLRHAARTALPPGALPACAEVDAAAMLGDHRGALAAALAEEEETAGGELSAKDALPLLRAALGGAPATSGRAASAQAWLAHAACARRAAALLAASGERGAAAALAARAADAFPTPAALLRLLPGGAAGGTDLRSAAVELIAGADDATFEALRLAARGAAAAAAQARAEAAARDETREAAPDDALFFFDVPAAEREGAAGTGAEEEEGEGGADLDAWMEARPGTRPPKQPKRAAKPKAKGAKQAAADASSGEDEDEP
jgi:SWI/SNF-related matrix-associated actin-dependent regulator 1 of chromatin subfamily A